MNIDARPNLSGAFVQSVWGHKTSVASGTQVTLSYGQFQRDDFLREGRRTFDAEFQDIVVWGGGTN